MVDEMSGAPNAVTISEVPNQNHWFNGVHIFYFCICTSRLSLNFWFLVLVSGLRVCLFI